MPNRQTRRAAARARLTTYATDAPIVEETSAALPGYWTGVIGVEGSATGDGRLIEVGALEWSTPIPLRFVEQDVGAHDGATSSGRILSIERDEDGLLHAYGDFDLGSAHGREAARLVQGGYQTGVSMDLDSLAFEVRVSEELLAEQEEMFDEMFGEGSDEPAPVEVDEDGRVKVFEGSADGELFVTTSGRIRAATLVSIPAFAEATIEALDSLPEEIMALVASAAPLNPPATWFSSPGLSEPTAITITDDGRVFGHLAAWDTCHVAEPAGAGVCVMAPKSKTSYAYFHTGAVKTSEGTQVPTGVLRFNTQHAGIRASADAAQAHYDHTGLAGADVHIGEDAHGIWVAGALRPGLSEEQVRTLRASPLSGDWRYIQGNLELVGALAVNLPGFPIPRPAGLVASGEKTMALVAAGMVATPESARGAVKVLTLSASDRQYLAKLIAREKHAEHIALSSRVARADTLRKIHETAAKLARGAR